MDGGLGAKAGTAAVGAGAGRSQGDASIRFREHIATDQRSFARKFGHYKGQMPVESGGEDGGSTTEDDSCHAAAALSSKLSTKALPVSEPRQAEGSSPKVLDF